MLVRWLVASVSLTCVMLGACSEETAELVAAAGAAGGAGLAGGGALDAGCAASACSAKLLECGNCVDDDSDGFVDSDDPDCLGACDDTESGFYPNLPGSPGAPCRADCFWDVGNGVGNDDCQWDHHCDPVAVAPSYPPEGPSCAYDASTKLIGGMSCEEAESGQSPACRDYCIPLTPNGCDCFGCCVVPGAPTPVWMGSVDCVSGTLADPTKCKPCTPITGCTNPCDECELCVGKPKPSTGCVPSGQCPAGGAPCGLAGQPACSVGSYCITGCCVVLPS